MPATLSKRPVACDAHAEPKKRVCGACCAIIPLLKVLPSAKYHPSFELAATVEHSFGMSMVSEHLFINSLIGGKDGALGRWLDAVDIRLGHPIDDCRLRRLSLRQDPCAHIIESDEDAAFVVAVPRLDRGFGSLWRRRRYLAYFDMVHVNDELVYSRLQAALDVAPRDRELRIDASGIEALTPRSFVVLSDGSHWTPVTTYDEHPIVVTPQGRVRFTVLPKPLSTSAQSFSDPIPVDHADSISTLGKRSKKLGLPRIAELRLQEASFAKTAPKPSMVKELAASVADLAIAADDAFEVVDALSEAPVEIGARECGVCGEVLHSAEFVPTTAGALPFRLSIQ